MPLVPQNNDAIFPNVSLCTPVVHSAYRTLDSSENMKSISVRKVTVMCVHEYQCMVLAYCHCEPTNTEFKITMKTFRYYYGNLKYFSYSYWLVIWFTL